MKKLNEKWGVCFETGLKTNEKFLKNKQNRFLVLDRSKQRCGPKGGKWKTTPQAQKFWKKGAAGGEKLKKDTKNPNFLGFIWTEKNFSERKNFLKGKNFFERKKFFWQKRFFLNLEEFWKLKNFFEKKFKKSFLNQKSRRLIIEKNLFPYAL